MDIQTVIRQPDTTLVDVREPYEFRQGHAPGAINIPLGSVPGRLDEFRRMQGPILLYCRSGNRSGQAGRYLNSQGITEAYNGGSLEMVNYFLLPQNG